MWQKEEEEKKQGEKNNNNNDNNNSYNKTNGVLKGTVKDGAMKEVVVTVKKDNLPEQSRAHLDTT